MPLPPAQNSPYGNGPQDIGSPVPQGPAPAAPQGGIPNFPAGGGASGEGQASGQNPEAPGAPVNPFDQPLTPSKQQQIKQMAAGEKNPFDEKDPHFPAGYMPISPRLRRNPVGDIEVLRHSGKWEPMSGDEVKVLSEFSDMAQTWGLRAKEDLPRFVGTVLGSVVAGRFGPVAATAGASAGQAVAGAASNYLQGKPNTIQSVGGDAISGAAAELLPRGMGRYLEQKGAQYAGEAAVQPVLEAGSKVLANRAKGRLEAAQELGLPLRKDQMMPENVGMGSKVDQIMMSKGPEAEKLAAAQALQKQMLLEKRDAIIDRLQGPYKGEIGDQGANFSQVFGTILNNHEAAISTIKQKAFDAAQGQTFDIEPVLSVMRDQINKRMTKNIFTDSGRVDARLLEEVRTTFGGLPENSKGLVADYMRLQNMAKVGQGVNSPGALKNSPLSADLPVAVSGVPKDAYHQVTPSKYRSDDLEKQAEDLAYALAGNAPRSTPGLTLPEMDLFRKKFGEDANFQSKMDRSELERAYGEIYYAMRSHMDGKMIDTLKPVDPNAASRLMGHKQFYSTFKEDISDFQKAVEHDPTNAAQALVSSKEPAQVKSLLAILDDKQKKYIAGGFLENLTTPLIDETGKMKVTSVDTAWRKVDPKVKQMLFGEDVKKIDSLLTYSKAIESRDVTAYDPTRDPMTQRALATMKSLKFSGGMDFVSKIFQRTPKARDYLTAQAADILMPVGQDQLSLARRQMIMERASKTVMSAPARLGAKAVSADLMSDHPQPAVEAQ